MKKVLFFSVFVLILNILYLTSQSAENPNPILPKTKIDDKPEALTNKLSAVFRFSGNSVTTVIECSFDDGAWEICESPKYLNKLADGSHSFAIRGKNLSGNIEPNPEKYSWVIDTTPPSSRIDSLPERLTNKRTFSFRFSSPEKGVKFSCKIDDSPWSECGGTYTTPNLSDGTHLFSLQAIDIAGNSEKIPQSFQWVVDTTPPKAKITGTPEKLTSKTEAVFSFASDEPGAFFKCRLDSGSWSDCASSQKYSNLTEGAHFFRVSAIDKLDNKELEGVQYDWRIDATAPQTEIYKMPAELVKSPEAFFQFRSDDLNASFVCKLDSGEWKSCSKEIKFTNISDGLHAFMVAATDSAGNKDETPAQAKWRVDLTLPVATIESMPNPVTASSDAQFSFKLSEAGTFECRLDKDEWKPCVSGKKYEKLGDGEHNFFVRGIDEAGNVGKESLFKWVSDTATPYSEITTKPGELVNTTKAVFFFKANEKTDRFECSIDKSPFEKCVDEKMFRDLTEGNHEFSVRAVDIAGNIEKNPQIYKWKIDLTPPKTVIDSNPPRFSNKKEVNFSFKANEKTARFECKTDASKWEKCVSGLAVSVGEGKHEFFVRAVDYSGNVEPEAQKYEWIADFTAPVTIVSKFPEKITNSVSAAFEFGANENVSSFECMIDKKKWEKCASGVLYKNMEEGAHEFSVRATDVSGNIEEKTPLINWKIDTTAPLTKITNQPESLNNRRDVTFAMSSNEPLKNYLCKFDSEEWTACKSEKKYDKIGEGKHSFSVKGVDLAGNIELKEQTFSWITDITPPTTGIFANPQNLTNKNEAQFEFRASESAKFFQCKLDESEWKNCNSPSVFKSLADGLHIFSVKSTDLSGNIEQNPPIFKWNIDTVAPVTKLSKKPSILTNIPATIFEFSTGETGSAYLCKIDNKDWKECVSPLDLKILTDGDHVFAVKAEDMAKNKEKDGAVFKWRIDTLPPETSFDKKPAQLINKSSAEFSFVSTEADSKFWCSLDNSAFESCEKTKVYKELSDAPHILAVKSVDKANNADLTPAVYSFTIDTTPPETEFSEQPPVISNKFEAKFVFAANEKTSYFECSLDKMSWQKCVSPVTFAKLAEGAHSFLVRAVDAAQNIESSPNSLSWEVDTLFPVTQIIQKPLSLGNAVEAKFKFKSNEKVRYQCKFDSDKWSDCTDAPHYKNISEGLHNLEVKSTDKAGNLEKEAVKYQWIVDLTPPDTTVFGMPAVLTNKNEAFFEFRGSETASLFECKLDAGSWEKCETGKNYKKLADGKHVFAVRAKDSAGNIDKTPSDYAWIVDTTAPKSEISDKPATITNQVTAEFLLSSNEEGAFECSVDNAPFAPCQSKKIVENLKDGAHIFLSRATDKALNTEAKPQKFTWTIDTVAPETTIVEKPILLTNDRNALFRISQNENGGFECRIDNAAWVKCNEKHSFTNLSEGTHLFEARAKDMAGNFDVTPANYSWSIDLTAPKTEIIQAPSLVSIDVNAKFEIKSNEAKSNFMCSLDAKSWQECASIVEYKDLPEGKHLFQVKAIDASGNESKEPTHFVWIIPMQFKKASAGYLHTCSIGKTDNLFCWGANQSSQIGDGTNNDRSLPKLVPGNFKWKTVSSGKYHSCGIGGTEEGESRLFCWGSNGKGQLGVGSTATKQKPEEVTGKYRDWVKVSSSYYHTCGIRSMNGTNKLFCWGGNENGQLGTKKFDTETVPAVVADKPDGWSDVSAGYFHTCGIRNENGASKLYCWGQGKDGQLGNSKNEPKNPVITEVSGNFTDWTSVDSGYYHTCGIRSENGQNKLYCFGYNSAGQLGNSSVESSNQPVTASVVSDKWKKIDAGFNYTCGIREESGGGSLYCFGYNSHSQLGDGKNLSKNIPTKTMPEFNDWEDVTTSEQHTCAIRKKSGRYQLYCWGSNQTGQVGDGSTERVLFPAEISGEILRKK